MVFNFIIHTMLLKHIYVESIALNGILLLNHNLLFSQFIINVYVCMIMPEMKVTYICVAIKESQ